MKIYVDDMHLPARVGRINGRWCHLVIEPGGDVNELHAFAQSIGLKREWFQDGRHPHYDVTESVRARAVAAGAQEITWRELGIMMVAREEPRHKESFAEEVQHSYRIAQEAESPEMKSCRACGKGTLHELCYDCRGPEYTRDLNAKVRAGLRDDGQMLNEMGLTVHYQGGDSSPYRFFYADVVRQPCPDCGRPTATHFGRYDVAREPSRCNECTSEALTEMVYEASRGLGYPAESEGSCAQCQGPAQVYGPGGRPLCGSCESGAAPGEALKALEGAGLVKPKAESTAETGPFRVMFTGSRGWTDRESIWGKLDELHAGHPGMVLVHGGCPEGGDAHAHAWAADRGVKEELHRPQWKRPDGSVDKAAGFARNTVMAKSGVDVCVTANLGTPGTTHASNAAAAAGVRVEPVGLGAEASPKVMKPNTAKSLVPAQKGVLGCPRTKK